jgi:hypothetical protein
VHFKDGGYITQTIGKKKIHRRQSLVLGGQKKKNSYDLNRKILNLFRKSITAESVFLRNAKIGRPTSVYITFTRGQPTYLHFRNAKTGTCRPTSVYITFTRGQPTYLHFRNAKTGTCRPKSVYNNFVCGQPTYLHFSNEMPKQVGLSLSASLPHVGSLRAFISAMKCH